MLKRGENGELSNYTVNKSTVERYEIGNKGSWSWANITISEDGDFNAISDYGNYNYAWRSFGKSFKEFLIRVFEKDSDYLYRKLCNRMADRVDCEETVKQFKKDLFAAYREKKRDYWYMEKDEASFYPRLEDKVRDAYDSLVSLEHEGNMSYDAFMNYIWNDSVLSEELFGPEYFVYADVVMTGDRECKAFCDRIAPVFAEILKNELAMK